MLDDILGYPVEDHIVDIRYYRPRGDNKEAWDNIDLVGFLGQKMQIKVNFLCRDSILAAPLVIEIARVLDLARQRGEGGIQEQLGLFFKAPMTAGRHSAGARASPCRSACCWTGSRRSRDAERPCRECRRPGRHRLALVPLAASSAT